jgi:hypothetical protein
VTGKCWKTKYRPVGLLLVVQSFLNSSNTSKMERATSCIQQIAAVVFMYRPAVCTAALRSRGLLF